MWTSSEYFIWLTSVLKLVTCVHSIWFKHSSKVSGLTLATYLYLTHIFEWFVVGRGFKNGHHKRNVFREDRTMHDPESVTGLRSIDYLRGRGCCGVELYDHLRRKRISTSKSLWKWVRHSCEFGKSWGKCLRDQILDLLITTPSVPKWLSYPLEFLFQNVCLTNILGQRE